MHATTHFSFRKTRKRKSAHDLRKQVLSNQVFTPAVRSTKSYARLNQYAKTMCDRISGEEAKKYKQKAVEYWTMIFGPLPSDLAERLGLPDAVPEIGLIDKKVKCPVQIGAEGSIEIMHPSRYQARIATRLGSGEKYALRAMVNHELKFGTALTYAPVKDIRFSWSQELDAKKTVERHCRDFGFKYGFCVEFGAAEL